MNTEAKLVIESTVNGIFFELVSPDGDSVRQMIFTQEVAKVQDALAEALAHCGKWEIKTCQPATASPK